MPDAQADERDPDNRLLSHQSRFRVDAEVVHDIALSVSGLLVERFGGPSVKPYQPDGYLADPELPEARILRQPRRRPLPPRRLHLLAAHLPAPQPADLRRAHARGVHRQPRELEHAAAGPGAAQRPHLRGSRARLRRAHPGEPARPGCARRLGHAPARSTAPPATRSGAILEDLYRSSLEHFRAAPADAEGLIHSGEAPVPANLQTRRIRGHDHGGASDPQHARNHHQELTTPWTTARTAKAYSAARFSDAASSALGILGLNALIDPRLFGADITTSKGVVNPAAPSRQGEAHHLPLPGGRTVAPGNLRLQAEAAPR